MKAPKTFFIGLFVFALSLAQLIATGAPGRLIGVGVGLFFMFWGWRIGWTAHRRLSVLLGHLAITAGLLVSAWAIYQLPFLAKPPSLPETLDLPLFWGLFTAAGGFCMITHGYCHCAIRMHDSRGRGRGRSGTLPAGSCRGG